MPFVSAPAERDARTALSDEAASVDDVAFFMDKHISRSRPAARLPVVWIRVMWIPVVYTRAPGGLNSDGGTSQRKD